MDSHKDHSKTKEKIKPLHFFIIFVAISTLTAFILGGFFIAKDKEKKDQLETTEITEQVKLSAQNIPDNPETWKEYDLPSIGLTLKLPESLIKKGEWNEVILENEYGKNICFTNKKLSEEDICEASDIIISSVSSEYSQTSSTFLTSKGIVIKNGKYFLVDSNNADLDLQEEKTKPFENENNFEILKILGNETNTSPDVKYLGAIINTSNENYPALILQMEIDGDISEYEFDQILESLKSIN